MIFSNQNMHKRYHTFQNNENKLKVSRTVFVLSRGGILEGKSARKFECYKVQFRCLAISYEKGGCSLFIYSSGPNNSVVLNKRVGGIFF